MLDEKSVKAAAGRPLERFAKVDIDGIMIHYRECGPKDAPAILLLHGCGGRRSGRLRRAFTAS
jgi:hypothetical protein